MKNIEILNTWNFWNGKIDFVVGVIFISTVILMTVYFRKTLDKYSLQDRFKITFAPFWFGRTIIHPEDLPKLRWYRNIWQIILLIIIVRFLLDFVMVTLLT